MRQLSSVFMVFALLMLFTPFVIRSVSASTPPVAEAGPDVNSVEGASVDFDGSASYDPDGTIESYEWDFGDASPKDYGVAVSHVYADDGCYTVELVVTDNDGLTGADTCTVCLGNVAPTVDAGYDQTVDEGETVSLAPATFEDPGFDREPITVETFTATIEWGDGTSEPQADIIIAVVPGAEGVPTTGTVQATHVYSDNALYMVTVTVTDDDLGAGSDTFTVTVDNVAPTVDAGYDQTVDEGETVSLAPATFNDKGTEDTHTATIDWGDGTGTEAGAVTEFPYGPPGSTAGMEGTVDGSHVYTSAGTYTVTVTVTDDDTGSTMDTLTVTVFTTGGVPEFPIGFALEIVVIPLVLYIWWKSKHRTLP